MPARRRQRPRCLLSRTATSRVCCCYCAWAMTRQERALRADAARNYERIVGAAVVAFEEVGPEVTLEEIAGRAAVSVATVYRRFRTRDQVVRAALDHVLNTEIEPMAAAHTGDPW